MSVQDSVQIGLLAIDPRAISTFCAELSTTRVRARAEPTLKSGRTDDLKLVALRACAHA